MAWIVDVGFDGFGVIYTRGCLVYFLYGLAYAGLKKRVIAQPKKENHMKHRTLAIILIVLLGGMAIFYNQSVSKNVDGDTAPKVEKAK